MIDLSDTDSPQVNNLVIADLLRGVQIQQEENVRRPRRRRKADPGGDYHRRSARIPFTQRISQMPVLFQQVAKIAKRGRNAGSAWSSSPSCRSICQTKCWGS